MVSINDSNMLLPERTFIVITNATDRIMLSWKSTWLMYKIKANASILKKVFLKRLCINGGGLGAMEEAYRVRVILRIAIK